MSCNESDNIKIRSAAIASIPSAHKTLMSIIKKYLFQQYLAMKCIVKASSRLLPNRLKTIALENMLLEHPIKNCKY